MPEEQVSNRSKNLKDTQFGLGGILIGLVFLVVLLFALNYFNLINLPFNLPKQSEQVKETKIVKELVEIEENIKPETLRNLTLAMKGKDFENVKYFTIRDPENKKEDINFYLIKTKNTNFNSIFLAREINLAETSPLITEIRFTFFPIRERQTDIKMRMYDSDKPSVIKDGLMDFYIQVSKESSNENVFEKVVIPTVRKVLGKDVDPKEERLIFSDNIVDFLKTTYQLSIYSDENVPIDYVRGRSSEEGKAIDKIIDNLKDL